MYTQFQNTSIRVLQSALYQTNVCIIQTTEWVLLVDPNWLPLEIEYIKNWVDQHLDNRKLYLLFTHSDYDHIIGYPVFAKAQTIASQAFVERNDQEKILQDIKNFDDQYYISRSYTPVYPPIDVVITESPTYLTLCQHDLHVYPTRGHTNDGLFTIIPDLGIWIAGDYLSDLEFPFIYDSYEHYQATIKLARQIIRQYDIKVMVPGHGKVCTSKEAVLQRIQKDEAYLNDLAEEAKDSSPKADRHNKEGNSKNWEKWAQQYDFPKGLKESHLANLKLVKKRSL